MSLLFACLVALCGHEDYRTRESAEAWLRWARPHSDAALAAGCLSPNPEVAVRCSRAAAGLAGRVEIGVGFRFQYNNYYVEVWQVAAPYSGGSQAYHLRSADHPTTDMGYATREEILQQLRDTRQPSGTFNQRPKR